MLTMIAENFVTLTDSDRMLSVKSGNPITIHDEDIGTAWPPVVRLSGDTTMSLADFEQEAPVDVPWPSVVLMHYTKLSRILGRIGEGKATPALEPGAC